MARTDFDIPEDLDPKARKIAEEIVGVIRARLPDADGGGCRLFYSPEEWARRGERYGKRSRLIVVYDGGDATHFFDWDERPSFVELMQDALRPLGVYIEPCTGWYSAIYDI